MNCIQMVVDWGDFMNVVLYIASLTEWTAVSLSNGLSVHGVRTTNISHQQVRLTEAGILKRHVVRLQ